MTEIRQSECRNLLIRSLSSEDFAALAGAFDLIEAEQGQRLCRAGQANEFVYFPETAIVSLTAGGDPARHEVGVIGREGLAGIPVILCDGICPSTTSVQVAGSLIRVPAALFRAVALASPSLLSLVLRYVQAFLIQTSSTTFANGTHKVEQRLARWLLMIHDRSGVARLHVTHQLMSQMLGVRRPGVTVATHVLEGEHAIRAGRGVVEILDRQRLREIASDGYGTAEAEYERLLGCPLSVAAGRQLSA